MPVPLGAGATTTTMMVTTVTTTDPPFEVSKRVSKEPGWT
jgi:hypothetical protein